MQLSPELRTWLLKSDHPDPFGEIHAQLTAMVDRLEETGHAQTEDQLRSAEDIKPVILTLEDGSLRHILVLRTADLERLIALDPSIKILADWDPDLHPREPGGSPEGGQFSPAGGTDGAIPAVGQPNSSDGSSPSGEWKSPGGWEHTGLVWKQETDPTTGRPIPIMAVSMEHAVSLVLEGKVVEVPDVAAAYTLIDKLATIAQEAKAAGDKSKDFDLCNVSVAGTNMFCVEKLRTAEYPEGVPRLEMPQLGGVPVAGSEADKLPRNPWDKTEVDGSAYFMAHLQGIGIKTSREVLPAAQLRASQRELIGSKVAKMMADRSFDPAKNPVFISSDNYVVDGHHRWAAVIGRDAEDGKLGDLTMNAIRVNAPITEVLHLANAWSAKFGIQQAAGVTAQAKKMGLQK